jgi:hypothetical protein
MQLLEERIQEAITANKILVELIRTDASLMKWQKITWINVLSTQRVALHSAVDLTKTRQNQDPNQLKLFPDEQF